MFSWLRAVAGENTSGGRIPSPTARNPPRRRPSFGRLHQRDSDSVAASASEWFRSVVPFRSRPNASPSTSLGALTRSTVLRVILSDSTELVEVLSKDELVERASGSVPSLRTPADGDPFSGSRAFPAGRRIAPGIPART